MRRCISLIIFVSCMSDLVYASVFPETYSSETLFLIPWGEEQGGYDIGVPTQTDTGFIPPIKGPDKFEVDAQGSIFIGSNAQTPAEVRKYSSDGTLLWRIQGATKYDFSRPLKERKFAGIQSMCCDNQGNIYIAELSDHHEDKIAQYGSDGRFIGFVATGFDFPVALKRHPDGGVSFTGRWRNNPQGVSFSYPCIYRDGVARLAADAGAPKGPNGRVYSGFNSEHDTVGIDRSTTPARKIRRGSMSEIILARYVSKPIERHWPKEPDREIQMPYPHILSGNTLHAADANGRLYVEVYIKDEAVPVGQKSRLLKIDPITEKIVAEIILIPGKKTRDLIAYPPVVIPETGDVYEFPDLPDGVHVIKHTLLRGQ